MSASFLTKCFLFCKFILLGSRNIQVFEKFKYPADLVSWDLQMGFTSFKGLMLY